MESSIEKSDQKSPQKLSELLPEFVKKTASKMKKKASGLLEEESREEDQANQEPEEEKTEPLLKLASDNKKFLLAVGITFAGYKIYKKITDDGNLSQDKKLDSSQITEAKVQAITAVLMAAMDRPGTNETAIMQALQGLNYNDFVRVSDAFGRKPYAGVGYSPLPFVPKLTLIEWLIEELDPENLKEVKKVLPDAF